MSRRKWPSPILLSPKLGRGENKARTNLYPRNLSNRFRVIRCTRSSGPCGRPW